MSPPVNTPKNNDERLLEPVRLPREPGGGRCRGRELRLQSWMHDALVEDQDRRWHRARTAAQAALNYNERKHMAAKKKAKKRTTLRSKTGTKLYAVRTRKGEFEDVQTYKRAQGQDEKRVSKAETAARKKAGKPARKAKKKATRK